MSAIRVNASFGGTAFQEIFEGQLAVGPDSGVDYVLTKIPGGNKAVLDVSGPTPRVLKLPIACTDAQLALLESKANSYTRASLVYHRGTTNARLMKVEQVRDAAVVDAHRATMELILG